MKDLLDSATSRRMGMIEYLLYSDNWITAAQLARKFNVSVRTVNNDIHFLKGKWSHIICFEISLKFGIHLRLPPNNTIKEIYRYIFEHSLPLTLIGDIFLNPTLSISEWAIETDRSEATLRRILIKMEEGLQKRNIFLSKRPLALVSQNECAVRIFMMHYLRECSLPGNWCLDLSSLDISQYVYQLIQDVEPASIPFFHEENAVLFYIAIVRYCQGFNDEPREIDPDRFAKLKDHFIKTKHRLQNIFIGYFFDLSDAFILNLYQAIFPIENKTQTLLKTQILSLIEDVQSGLSISIEPDEVLSLAHSIQFKVNHYQCIGPFNYIVWDNSSMYLHILKKEFPEDIEKISTLVKTHLPFPLQPNSSLLQEIIYTFYIEWTNLSLALEDRKKVIRIALISDISYKHATILSNQLSKRFGSFVQLTRFFYDCVNPDYFDQRTLEAYDVLISTFTLTTQSKDKLIQIDAILTEASWKNIAEKILEIRR